MLIARCLVQKQKIDTNQVKKKEKKKKNEKLKSE